MKNLIIAVTLLSSLVAQASFDQTTLESMEPKAEELQASRSCFKDLAELGCRHPSEDLENFKSCMENIYPSLSQDCQKMMSELYRKRS